MKNQKILLASLAEIWSFCYVNKNTGISRRSFLGASLAALGTLAVPDFALARQARSLSPLPTPEPPNAEQLAALVRSEFDRVGTAVSYRDRAAIADFSRPSHVPRLFLMDMEAGTMRSYLVAHGRGSDPAHEGMLQRFSNRPGSFATSKGAYVTTEQYDGRYGYSMRLAGLDPTNNEAYDRAIVIHEAWYANPDMIRRHGKLGRSEGCFTVSEGLNREVIDFLGSGRLLFADKLDDLPPLPRETASAVAPSQPDVLPSAPPPFYDFSS